MMEFPRKVPVDGYSKESGEESAMIIDPSAGLKRNRDKWRIVTSTHMEDIVK